MMEGMSMPLGMGAGGMGGAGGHPLKLEFPQSLAVYETYAEAQRAVDFLADRQFPVENCMIVGTDLKTLERITGRLTWGRIALGGALSGVWLGMLIGIIFWVFTDENVFAVLLSTALMGAIFGLIWAVIGYAATGGRRDFSSVRQVVATKYEVLVEHKHAAKAREMLGDLKGGLPDPFA